MRVSREVYRRSSVEPKQRPLLLPFQRQTDIYLEFIRTSAAKGYDGFELR